MNLFLLSTQQLKKLSAKIVTNSAWLLSSQLLTKLFGLFYNIFLARSLGPSDYGIFIFGLTIFGLVASMADFGLSRFLTRELSKDTLKASFLIPKVLIINVLTVLLLIIGVITTLFLLDHNFIRLVVAVIMTIAVLPNSLSQIISSVFVAIEKMKLVAFGQFFLSLLVLLFTVVVTLVIHNGVTTVALIFLVSNFLFLVLSLLFLFGERIRLYFRLSISDWHIIKFSFPYAILTILGIVYFRIDSILLTYLRGNLETGIYGAAYRFIDGAQFIPIAVSTAVFPTFARLHEVSLVDLKKVYLRSVGLLSVIGILVSLFLFLFSNGLIRLVYGPNYQGSITALQILSFAVFFQFIHIPGAHLLFASQKFLGIVILLSCFTVGFNIIANILFIPIYGYLAAAAVTVISEFLSFMIFFNLIWFKLFRIKT